MDISAGELEYKLFRLYQDGITIPEFDKIAKKLKELSNELGDVRKDIDYWCERLSEFKACRGTLEAMKE